MFQVRWGAEYLMKLWRPATRAADGYTLIYQVGNWSLESQYWGTYEDLTAANMPRPGYNISTASGKLVCAGVQFTYAMWTEIPGNTHTRCLSLCTACLAPYIVLWVTGRKENWNVLDEHLSFVSCLSSMKQFMLPDKQSARHKVQVLHSMRTVSHITRMDSLLT